MAQEKVQTAEQEPKTEKPKHHSARQPCPFAHCFGRFATSPASEQLHPRLVALGDGRSKDGSSQSEEQE
ncbi:hypothetical protein [Arthrobacter sp. N1]|uniref:hypothetical protein n=1 Tax=Arthrobacter sp. N1 TaxID=619291 RepID=UPI003BB054EC